MKSDGLSPDVYSYAGCIDACAKAAQWKKACQILGQMREAGVEVGKGSLLHYFPYQLHVKFCVRSFQQCSSGGRAAVGSVVRVFHSQTF